LVVDAGSTVHSGWGYLGYNPGSSGTATVNGLGSVWASGLLSSVGHSGAGTLNVEAGGNFTSRQSSLGYHPGSIGCATVTGSGSIWVAGWDYYVGRSGSGTANIRDGGGIHSTTSYVGFDADSVGAVLVHGAGSVWQTHYCYVGYSGSGTLDIVAGATANSTSTSFIGYYSGSSGSVTVSGAGSQWTSADPILVGYRGSGQLTVADGSVVKTSTLFASLDNLYGDGTIQASGAVLDADLVFDSTHGMQQAVPFGQGGTLHLALTSSSTLGVGHQGTGTLRFAEGVGVASSESGYLGYAPSGTGHGLVTGPGTTWSVYGMNVGYEGNGVLRIEEGGQVISQYGYVGRFAGSGGTVTVSGPGSKWAAGSSLYIDSGSLAVSDGGLVTTGSLYASLDDLSGDGTISTGGAILDADLVFDTSRGTNQSLSFGERGTLNLNVQSKSNLGVGYKADGTLRIADGFRLSTGYGSLGHQAGATGIATVTGVGTQWNVDGQLHVGHYGNGILTIEEGAEVVAHWSSIEGAATVTGPGSKLTSRFELIIRAGGSLTVTDGATVDARHLYGSLSQLHGDGTIVTRNATLDADLVFDATRGTQQTIPFGSGGSLNLTVNQSTLGVGYNGNGTLRIADGLTVAVSSGYMGYGTGSTGAATITGAGTKWVMRFDAHVGEYGYGTMRIEDGAEVSNRSGWIASNNGAGAVTVTGAGSQWNNQEDLYVGMANPGTLTVTDGGSVTAKMLYASLSDLYGDGTITTKGALLDADLVFDATHGLQQSLVFGDNGTLNIGIDATVGLGVGFRTSGTLRISDGAKVVSAFGQLGSLSGSAGTATVTGIGSIWNNAGDLAVREAGSELTIEAGGQVVNHYGILSDGARAMVTGPDSRWNNTKLSANGTLLIDAGGHVISTTGYIGEHLYAAGATTVTGPGSVWSNSGALYVGDWGTGLLHIGPNGLSGSVRTKSLILANSTTGCGILKLDSGTLQVQTISSGSGSVVFSWNGGAIQNYDASTDLTLSAGFVVRLAETNDQLFDVTTGRTGTIHAILADATSGGTLNKTGMGTLLLTAVNTYSGGTTVEEGLFKVTGSILNASNVSINESAVLELARTAGSATAATLPVNNDGTLLISTVGQQVGTIVGTGVTQIDANGSLTADWIVQDSLIIGAGGQFVLRGSAGASATAQVATVPEPSTAALILITLLAAMANSRRCRR
jgi:T5SS/PEP-CTERM-associated repeat protein/autotransporter-associated beta strand protein